MAKTKKTDEESMKKSATGKKAATAQPPVETPDEIAAKPSQDTPQTEPAVSMLEGVELPATSGKAGVLGGAKDRGIKPEDKLALPVGRHFTYERVRSLNPKSFYCAMRWEYRVKGKSPEEGKRWWANKKLVITNPVNGNRVIVRAVDYGPHENTGLTISLSPAAREALALEIGGEVNIEFADQKAFLGVLNA
jgi:hypothetical protein